MTLPTGTMAPLLAIMVAVPTSNTCRMCGALPARKAAMAAVMDSVVAALVGGHDLVVLLAGVEVLGQVVDPLAQRAGHRMPPLDLGLGLGGQGSKCGAAASRVKCFFMGSPSGGMAVRQSAAAFVTPRFCHMTGPPGKREPPGRPRRLAVMLHCGNIAARQADEMAPTGAHPPNPMNAPFPALGCPAGRRR
jgi:hypothetical protein